jgi:phenylalanyl-tRNA synthetase beta chain
MKVTLGWLKDYVALKIPAKELADKLTMVGLEVTSLEKRGKDWIFDIEVTTNRPDCLSVVGIAREVAAITKSKIKNQKSKIHIKIPKQKTKNQRPIYIEIKDKKGCSGYLGRVIEDVQVRPSPEWLKKRLEQVGIRPVNNIVDITNYVLIETGQPLHAFDYDKLTASSIIVRRAKRDEKIVTIDGVERKLNPGILVIADADKSIAVAGIMGGRDTQVTNQTKNILLESAYFDAATIRRAAKLLGITTESSYRFERGVTKEGVLVASDRAVSLITELTAGRLVAGQQKRQRAKDKRKEITLRTSRVNQILGTNLSVQEIKRILESLQLKVKGRGLRVKVAIPSFRRDLSREIDLIEELIRIYGYAKIPISFPYIKPTAHSPQPRVKGIENLVREILISQGANEIITYSLLSQDLVKRTSLFSEKNLISIRNPLSSEQELMRPSLIPGMLNCLSYNLNRQIKDIKIFELGHIYSRYTSPTRNTKFLQRNKISNGASPKENLHLAIAITGKRYDDWLRKLAEASLFDLKGILEVLFERLGISAVEFSNGVNCAFLSEIKVKGDAVGFIGQVARGILEEFDIAGDIYVAEVLLDRIWPHLNLEKRFKPLPKYPLISRDMAIVIKEEILSSQVASIITDVGGSILSDLKLFDQYYGKQIPQGYKSLAYCLRYQLKNRTLTDQEVTEVHAKICQALMEKLGAKIR